MSKVEIKFERNAWQIYLSGWQLGGDFVSKYAAEEWMSRFRTPTLADSAVKVGALSKEAIIDEYEEFLARRFRENEKDATEKFEAEVKWNKEHPGEKRLGAGTTFWGHEKDLWRRLADDLDARTREFGKARRWLMRKKATDAVCEGCVSDGGVAHASWCAAAPDSKVAPSAAAIREAVLAERRACAEIADDCKEQVYGLYGMDFVQSDAAAEIARKIRERE